MNNSALIYSMFVLIGAFQNPGPYITHNAN